MTDRRAKRAAAERAMARKLRTLRVANKELVGQQLADATVAKRPKARRTTEKDERNTTPEMATLATRYMDDPNPDIRRLAASVLSNRRTD